jgi:hypothetical protein
MNHLLTCALGAGIAFLVGGLFAPTAPLTPDLQGTWTNATQTRLERAGSKKKTLTVEAAAALEQQAARGVGGDLFSDPGFDVIRINGEARSSILIDPPDGRLPPRTEAGQKRIADITARRAKFGEFDHPEVRPLGERCLVSFGSNAGPPMLPNYQYSNIYTIVQTQDHVMVLTEMNNDARIIRMNATTHLPNHIRPWFGDSIGRWEGTTLVVETTNIHPAQVEQTDTLWAYRGGSDKLKVTERFTLTRPDTILYRFTLEDPDTFTAPFTGELLFRRTEEMLYEYACHEGNYSIALILAGERAKERREAESGTPQ